MGSIDGEAELPYSPYQRVSALPEKDHLDESDFELMYEVLRSGQSNGCFLVCEAITSHCDKIALQYTGLNNPQCVDVLIELLNNSEVPVDLRIAIVRCLAELGAAYQRNSQTVRQWIIGRLLDRAERGGVSKQEIHHDASLREAFIRARSRFEILSRPEKAG